MAPIKSKKVKKVINQEELRRLMREKQRQTPDKKKRIESPYAKYNSLGHLSCVVCNVQVKSEILWQTHILGKQHKETISELKGSKQLSSPSPAPQPSSLKRKASDSEHVFKIPKPPAGTGQSTSGLPADFFSKPEKASGSAKNSRLSLLAGIYDEQDDDDEEASSNADQGAATSSHVQKGEPAPGLPADFFDDSPIPPAPTTVSHSGSILKADESEKSFEKKENTAEALPEGFFDDPVRDAKVRNVDAPKDQMDKEWDEFQKEMRQVNTKSEAIVAEDDEEGRLERQIDEIDEQIECYRRVEILRDKQDVVKGKIVKDNTEELDVGSDEEEEEEEEDEEELLHLLARDWRAKGALA